MALYKYQERLKQLVLAGKSIILQAPTGSGKTRAALTPLIETFWDAPEAVFPKKAIYAVPMRVLANQFKEDHEKLAQSYQRRFKREINVKRQTGEYAEDPEFKADLLFATIDQVLSSWLLHPYGLSRRKGNLNAGALVGSYLVFDEFHLFDPDSTLPTTLHMLKALKGVSPFVLMTATFSRPMLTQLGHILGAETLVLTDDELAELPSLKKTRQFKVVTRPLAQDENIFTQNILDQHTGQIGHQRSIVILNQVKRAQAVFRQLRQEVPAGTIVKLLHSRFRPQDRATTEAFVRREFGKERDKYTAESIILVATQAIEVGVDITCQVLHTELAPASSVLQRAGRCARYERETGKVFVYDVPVKAGKEGNLKAQYAPYHGKLAKRQCELTWVWLQEHDGQILDFPLEQELINHAHAETDQQILDGLQATAEGRAAKIENVWAGNQESIADLVRQVQSQAIIIHSDPDNQAILQRPFQTEMFSLYPGTLKGLWEEWQLLKDDDFNDIEWLAYKLVEDKKQPDKTDEEAAQGNRPPNYDWLEVHHSFELVAPVLLINPKLVGYDNEIGLELVPGTPFESALPSPKGGKASDKIWQYKLESYAEHIRLVHEAWRVEWDKLAPSARRLERVSGWAEGVLDDLAQVVVWAHDLGKLTQKWQVWAQEWQKAIGREIPTYSVAHTDYDSADEHHRQMDKKLRGKRPSHAVESAVLALPYLSQVTQGNPTLLKAGFSAIARHHAPFSSEPQSFELDKGYQHALAETANLLPPAWRTPLLAQPVRPSFKVSPQFMQNIESSLMTNPQIKEEMMVYMLLVRGLRTADQLGTIAGSV